MLFKDKELHTKLGILTDLINGLSNQFHERIEEDRFHRRDIMNQLEKLQEKFEELAQLQSKETQDKSKKKR